MIETGSCVLANCSLKKLVFRLLSLNFFYNLIVIPLSRLWCYIFWVHISSKTFVSCSLWFVPIKILYTRTTFRHFSKLSMWPLLIYPLLTISYKKVIFQFHYNKVELYVVILHLAYSYWNLVNTYIHELISAIGIPVFI